MNGIRIRIFMSAPLTRSQKSYLAQLSERAYRRALAMARGSGEEESFLGEFRDGESYRHEMVARAVGKLGLRCCSQDDYAAVKGHFLEALGEHGAAFNAALRGASNARRVVEWKIFHECVTSGLHPSYADKICRAQNHGKTITEIDDVRRLWAVFYTVRNRGRSHKRTAAQAA